MRARRTVRLTLWALWGVALVVAPAVTYYLKWRAQGSPGMSPLDFAWSSSLPLAVLAAALAYAAVERLRRRARPITIAAGSCSVAYLVSLGLELARLREARHLVDRRARAGCPAQEG